MDAWGSQAVSQENETSNFRPPSESSDNESLEVDYGFMDSTKIGQKQPEPSLNVPGTPIPYSLPDPEFSSRTNSLKRQMGKTSLNPVHEENVDSLNSSSIVETPGFAESTRVRKRIMRTTMDRDEQFLHLISITGLWAFLPLF
jgi:hypothetical protein